MADPWDPPDEWPEVPDGLGGRDDPFGDPDLAPWYPSDSWFGTPEELGAAPSRSRHRRVIAALTAGSLLLAAVGTGVGYFVTGGNGEGPMPATVDAVTPGTSALAPPGHQVAIEGAELVTFSVRNGTGSRRVALCTVTVLEQGSPVGSVTVETSPIVIGGTVRGTVRVPVDHGAFVADPGNAEVACAA